MNIVHVVESLALGGLERVVVSLAGIQVRHGHRVLVVCLFKEGVLADDARSAGAAVMACGKTDGLDLRALRKMRHAIRSFRADVVHSHNAVAHYYAAMATLLGGVRTLLNTRHGMGSFPFSWRRRWATTDETNCRRLWDRRRPFLMLLRRHRPPRDRRFRGFGGSAIRAQEIRLRPLPARATFFPGRCSRRECTRPGRRHSCPCIE